MTEYTAVASSDWGNPLTWSPQGVPGARDIGNITAPFVVTVKDARTASGAYVGHGAGLTFIDEGSMLAKVSNGGTVTINTPSEVKFQSYAGTFGGVLVMAADSRLAVLDDFENTGDLTLNAGSKLTTWKTASMDADVDIAREASWVLGGAATFGGPNGAKTLTLLTASSVVTGTAPGVTLTNQGIIDGGGRLGAGSLTIANGFGGRGIIRADDDDTALIVDTGRTGTLRNGVLGVIEAAGEAQLSVESFPPGGSKVENQGVIRAREHGEVQLTLVDLVNNGTAEKPALIQATDIGTLTLDNLEVKNSAGQILADQRGTLRLNNATVRGGAVTVTGRQAALIATGKNSLFNGTFDSTGLVLVQNGSRLAVSTTAASTLAAATVYGELNFTGDLTLKGGQRVVLGLLDVNGATLTNVDEQVVGPGTIRAGNLVNQAKGSLSGDIRIELPTTQWDRGKLTNEGTISGGTIKARLIDNAGTISGVSFDVPFSVLGADSGIEQFPSGVIDSSAFGRLRFVGEGRIQAVGAGKVTSFAGTRVFGSTLSSSNGGTLLVKAASAATHMDVDGIEDGSRLVVANGAALEFEDMPSLGRFDISLLGGGQATNLTFLGTTGLQGTTIRLADGSDRLQIVGLTNAGGLISGAGEVVERTPETRSLLTTTAGGTIEAKGGTLTVKVDRLVNDGVLRADNGTLTVPLKGTIQGTGQAVVANGGKIDLSDARAYLGNFRYEGPGTILGPDLVPAGTISGFSTGDRYIFGKSNGLEGPLGTQWTANADGIGGTLTILTANGGTYANLVLAGARYTEADFVVTQVALADGNHVAVNFAGAVRWAQPVTGDWQDAAKWAPTGLAAPGPNDNALIEAAGAAYEVRVTQDTTVRSVATGGSGDLEIQKGRFTVLQGTDKGVNGNAVRVMADAGFTVGGRFRQTAEGQIFVLDKGQLALAQGGWLDGGTVYVRAGGRLSATQGAASWSNVDVSNGGTIDVGGSTTLTASRVQLRGDGTTTVGADASLLMQDSSASGGALKLQGTLRVNGTVSLKTEVQMSPGARIGLGAETGTLVNNGKIIGEGVIGGSGLILNNRDQIVADVGKTLRLDTGDNLIGNAGNIFASAGATLTVASKLDNQIGLRAVGGKVVLEKASSNGGVMLASGANGSLDFRDTVSNAGTISATGGGIVTIGKQVVQTGDGTLVADGRGANLGLVHSASVNGGQIVLNNGAYLAPVGRPGVSAGLNGVNVTMDASSWIWALVTYVDLTDTALTGGSVRIVDGTVRTGGTVTLSKTTTTHLQGGAITDGGRTATLTNAGTISSDVGPAKISGSGLHLVNSGQIVAGPGQYCDLTIDTGANAVDNTGLIQAAQRISALKIVGALNNRGGEVRAANGGNVTLGMLRNVGGVVTADGSFSRSTIEIKDDVRNEAGGSLKVNGDGRLRVYGAVINDDATIQITAGLMTVLGEMTNGGRLLADVRGRIELGGGLVNTGTVQITNSGSLSGWVDGNSGKIESASISTIQVEFRSDNEGDISATSGGRVIVDSGLVNRNGGRLLAQDGGSIEVRGAVQGGTARLSGQNARLDVKGDGSRDSFFQVSFGTNQAEQLALGHAERFSGSLRGFGIGDTLDVTDIAYDPAHGTYQYDRDRDQLVVSDGVHTATIALLGDYAANAFVFGSDGHGGTQVGLAPPTGPAPELATLLAAHA